ncbi:MAG: reverse transcriptase domain-containing protein [Candidatus Thiodiazotropha taylori]|nr:endonuclease/exonuclease/phosphatase family protein [Candidatus Thiodiazotropha taylori]MCW4286070.1 reverse transcriptase domain-containing protein [Candidatus Thiodiazotropha taylori]
MNQKFVLKIVWYFYLISTFWISRLILLAGDIETNPGPDMADLSSSFESTFTHDASLFQCHFSLVHYNVQSLRNKIDQIQAELSHFDVIALTETWLSHDISDDAIKILNYQDPFRKDRQTNNYGGVLVYVRENIPCKRRHELEMPDLECIWLELKVKSRSVLFGLFYRPPSALQEVYDKIEQSIDLALDSNINDVVITGDFNLNYIDTVGKNKINQLFTQYSLAQIINEPTHFTENSSSLIDLLFTNQTTNVLVSGVGEPFLDQNIRYHCPIYAVFNYDKQKPQSYKRKIWTYDKGDYELLRRTITDFDWQTLKSNDINVYAENVTSNIIGLCEKSIPNKVITIRPSDPPWFNNSIRKSIRKRKRAHKNAKRLNTADSWRKFRHLRNDVINIIRTSKKDFKDKIANKLKHDKLSGKDWWKLFKKLTGKDKTDPIPSLNYQGEFITDQTEKANIFNVYFQSQSTIEDDNKPIPHLAQPTNTISSINVQQEEVCSILKSLPTGKACGPDQINNKILKECAQQLSGPLTDLFNFSLENSSMPDAWKKANVTPIYKKDDKTLVENHRPISLLSSIGKSLEKVVHKHLHNFLLENNIITPFQSGFTQGDSTVNQLVDLYNTFSQALDEGKEVRVVFCDISKAFDRVWHKGLLAKLKHYGISGRLLHWFESYLSNRYQRVVLPGGKSEWLQIRAGVPQGSILGPLLFIIYINDIVHAIHSNIRLFADDTSLYIIVDFPDAAAQILNADLFRIGNWADRWLVNYNPNKTESLLLSRKINRVNHPALYLNEVRINEVTSHKHLGLIFSQRCDWQNHIEYIQEKAWSRMNLLRSIKFTLDRKSLQKIYFSFIRSLLEYADVVWDNCTQQQCNALEKIQLEAGRIVSGTTKLVEIDKLYAELGWLKLSERRNLHKLYLFFKMENNLTPLYLTELIPPRVGDVSAYPLRNSDHYLSINANTSSYANSFLPSTIEA